MPTCSTQTKVYTTQNSVYELDGGNQLIRRTFSQNPPHRTLPNDNEWYPYERVEHYINGLLIIYPGGEAMLTSKIRCES